MIYRKMEYNIIMKKNTIVVHRSISTIASQEMLLCMSAPSIVLLSTQ